MNYCKDFIVDRGQLQTAIHRLEIQNVIGLLANGVAIEDANGDNALHVAVEVVCFSCLAITASVLQNQLFHVNYCC